MSILGQENFKNWENRKCFKKQVESYYLLGPNERTVLEFFVKKKKDVFKLHNNLSYENKKNLRLLENKLNSEIIIA